MSKEDDLQRLKAELGKQLICDPAQLKRPEGIPTGLKELDQFLLWNGFPKGALSILTGKPGLGATSLWLGAAAQVTKQGRWAVWVDQSRNTASADRETQLFPLHLWQRELALSRLVTIEAPEETEAKAGRSAKKLLWLLQELMASTLFDLIGCDLGQVRLRDTQVRQLEKQARRFNTALVFIAGAEPKAGIGSSQVTGRYQTSVWNPALYSLVVNFKAGEIEVARALHKPTPHLIKRRVSYESFTINRSGEQLSGQSLTEHDRLFSSLSANTIKGLEPRALFDSSKYPLRERR